MHDIHTRIHQDKTDLIYAHQIAKPTSISQIGGPKNLTQLLNALKFKNAKSTLGRKQKQQTQRWQKEHGIDPSNVYEILKKAKELNAQKIQLKKIQEDCIFYIPNMTHEHLEEYSAKANQYSALSLALNSMMKPGHSKSIMARSKAKTGSPLFGAQLKKGDLSAEQIDARYLSITSQPRSQEKKQNYLKCIKLWAKDHGRNIRELAKIFSQGINTKMWQIVSSHINCISQMENLTDAKGIAELYMESLKMLEDEYKKEMPVNAERLDTYIENNFLTRVEKSQGSELKLSRGSGDKFFWAKAFAFYRAGMRGDFYTLLGGRCETELLRCFKEVDESIREKEPITKSVQRRIDDVFYEQLVYALEGENKYSNAMLANPQSRDVVWILTRNLGIFYERKRDEVEKYRKELLEFYRRSMGRLNLQQMYNYFYVLGYDELIKIGTSDIMDQDDFVHFLICLAGAPELVNNQTETVRSLLSLLRGRLLLYITELINLNRPEYIYYMLCLPREYQVKEISNILLTSNCVHSFDWQFLKANLPSADFQLIVENTIGKHIDQAKDYLLAADKFTELLANGEQSIRCLLKYLVKNLLSASFDDEGAYSVQVSCDKYIYLNPQTHPGYKQLLNFLIEARKLRGLITKRQPKQIYELIKESPFIVLGTVVMNDQLDLLKIIIDLADSTLDVYFKYLKSVVHGANIYFKWRGDNSEFVNFLEKMAENAKEVLRHVSFQQSVKRHQTVEFVELLKSFSVRM